jgi:hypothetical protein
MLAHRPLLIYQTISMRSHENTRGTDGAVEHTTAAANEYRVGGAVEAVEAAQRLILVIEEVLLEKNHTLVCLLSIRFHFLSLIAASIFPN